MSVNKLGKLAQMERSPICQMNGRLLQLITKSRTKAFFKRERRRELTSV